MQTHWRTLSLSSIFIIFSLLFSAALFAQSNDEQNSLQLTAEEKAWLAAHPKIRVGHDAMYRPIEYTEDGEFKGLSRDYMNAVEKKLGIQFVYTTKSSWSETFQAVADKKIDMITAAQITPKRQQHISFTAPYIQLKTVMVAAHYKGKEPLELDNLNGKTVATVKGYFWNELLPADYPEVNLLQTSSLPDGLEAIAFGKADAFMDSYATVSNYIQEKEITSLRVVGNAPYQINYAAGVRNDWPLFTSILNKALKSITIQEQKAIRDKWIGLGYEAPAVSKKFVYTLFTLFSAAIAALIGVLAWSNSLKRQVSNKTKELRRLNEDLEFKVHQRTQELQSAHQRLRLRHEELQEFTFKLEDEANRDELTLIANRRGLNEFLHNAIASTQEKNEPLTVIMADIDYFKQYNDMYGHLMGDTCLQDFARLLQMHTKRDGELAARFGGEEFTLVMSGMDKVKSLQYCDDLLNVVREFKLEHKGSPILDKPYLTCSFGIYTMLPSDDELTPMQMLDLGDKALYEAKQNGRDQAMHYDDIVS